MSGWSSRTAVTDLVHALDATDDARLARAVAVVDALPIRGEADALIAPIRYRLSAIRPTRPLTFGRLLFTPLDPVVVAGPAWRHGCLGIPRTALAPIAAQVRRAMAGSAADIDAAIAGQAVNDRPIIQAVGPNLWPIAAKVLANAAMPPGWAAATGLGTRDHADLRRVIAAVLSVANTMEPMLAGCSQGVIPDRVILRRILSGAAAATLGSATLLAILIARLPDAMDRLASSALGISDRSDTKYRAATDEALDFTLDAFQVEAELEPDLDRAAEIACRMAVVFDGLTKPGPWFRPSRKMRVATLRRDADLIYRKRFDAELATRLAAVSASGNANASPYAPEVIERSLRDLRRLEAAARRIGSAEYYAEKLHLAAGTIAGTTRPSAERARLVELLDAPQAAGTLLALGS